MYYIVTHGLVVQGGNLGWQKFYCSVVDGDSFFSLVRDKNLAMRFFGESEAKNAASDIEVAFENRLKFEVIHIPEDL